MENDILFEETQRFKPSWILLILMCIYVPVIVILLYQSVTGKQLNDKIITNSDLLIITIAAVLIILLFQSMKMVTIIKKEGIFVRFYPFHLSYRQYSWDMIAQAFVRQYNPVAEYGGWGLRFGMFGKGKAFNVSGDKGLQLIFTDDSKLLIGTQKPDELSKVLHLLGK